MDKDVFAKYVSKIYEALQSFTKDFINAPRYFQFFAWIFFYAFIIKGVNIAIYKTHQDDKFNATNIILKSVVTAITSIDKNHLHQLDLFLKNIVWHKAEIFKVSVSAFLAPQQNAVATMLERQVAEKEIAL